MVTSKDQTVATRMLQEKAQNAARLRGLRQEASQEAWRKLDQILDELPFRPPYQYKSLLEERPYPDPFDADVAYWGSSLDDAGSWFEIEWIRLRPRYLVSRGRLVSPETRDCSQELRAALTSAGIPFDEADGDFRIDFYRQDPGSS